MNAGLFEARGKLDAPSDLDAILSKLTELGALLDHAKPGQRQLMFEWVNLSEEGFIQHIAPVDWARQVFGELVWAWKHLPSTLQMVPPKRFELLFWP